MFREGSKFWTVYVDAEVPRNHADAIRNCRLPSCEGTKIFEHYATEVKKKKTNQSQITLVHKDTITSGHYDGRDHIHLLSFEKFLPQWMNHKFSDLEDEVQFSVHVHHVVKGKFGFTIIAWGLLNEQRCLLAVCYATYFSDAYHHAANHNLAYIEKTESIGFSVLAKKYLRKARIGSKTTSITIAMKAAFVEYMSICGCKVHLWAYPAALEEGVIDDLLLRKSHVNRSRTVQERTQAELLDGYKREYSCLGISHAAYQLHLTESVLTAVPEFVTPAGTDEVKVDLDIKQADFVGAAGKEIAAIKDTLAAAMLVLRGYQEKANDILKNGTLVLTTNFAVCRNSGSKVDYSDNLKLYVPQSFDDSLLKFIGECDFDGEDNVLASSAKIATYLSELEITIA